MSKAKIICLICGIGLLTLPVAGKDKPGKEGRGHKANTEAEAGKPSGADEKKEMGSRTFSPDERHAILGYVDHYGGKKGKRLPPGLAKKVARGGELPPGWQKKCVRGEIMSAEVYAKCHPLPPELVVKLPLGPPDTITVSISGRVVRLVKATLEILDVFDVHVRI